MAPRNENILRSVNATSTRENLLKENQLPIKFNHKQCKEPKINRTTSCKLFSVSTEETVKFQEEEAEEKSLIEIYDKLYNDFCSEITKGTEIIVIDNTNLAEWEYVRFIKKA